MTSDQAALDHINREPSESMPSRVLACAALGSLAPSIAAGPSTSERCAQMGGYIGRDRMRPDA